MTKVYRRTETNQQIWYPDLIIKRIVAELYPKVYQVLNKILACLFWHVYYTHSVLPVEVWL